MKEKRSTYVTICVAINVTCDLNAGLYINRPTHVKSDINAGFFPLHI